MAEVSYTYKAPLTAYPIGSIFLTLLGIVWTLVSYLFSSDTSTALAMTIGLFMLAFLEYTVRWYKSTIHNGTFYKISDEGVYYKTGRKEELFPWKEFSTYETEHDSKRGNVVQYLPLSGFILSDIDSHSFRLHNAKQLYSWDDHFLLPVIPEKIPEVEDMLSRRLTKK